MKALMIIPGKAGAQLVERPEPIITRPDELKIRVLRVGICGTDREAVAGGRAKAPAGATGLVIGHEMVGRVVAVGAKVRNFSPGALVVLTVRRGCGHCLPCAVNRQDMCRTGDYQERGIWGLDGYLAEYVVEQEAFAIAVSPELADLAVLAEPLSIAEKAITEAVQLQVARLPEAQATPDWLFKRRCLVAGLGPVGLLAALALRLRGAEVFGLDVVESHSIRSRWLEGIGGTYLDGRQMTPTRIGAEIGEIELIFESTGVATLEFNLLDALGLNGVYVLTGIPGGERSFELSGSDLIRDLVLKNQLMFGSVNACRDHYRMAVEDLDHARQRWESLINKLITHAYPCEAFSAALQRPGPDEIKAVLEWEPAEPSLDMKNP